MGRTARHRFFGWRLGQIVCQRILGSAFLCWIACKAFQAEGAEREEEVEEFIIVEVSDY